MGLKFPGGTEWYDPPVETAEEFVARMDRAGIEAVAFVGRNRASSAPDWPLTNEWVAEVMHQHPGRFFGFAGVDAERLEVAVDVITYGIRQLGLIGAALDPFQIDASADDPRFDVVFETCAELDVPLILTFGAGPGIPADLRCWPLALDHVARHYPMLKIVACHGAWPFMTEMIAAAWRHPNLYFDNSFYHFAPGAEVVVEAVNSMIEDKMVYASAYPFCPLEETLVRFKQLGFTDEARRKVLYDNAAGILGLEVNT
jgi:predicted TIM-barrel fold metal-dependent hydrolase